MKLIKIIFISIYLIILSSCAEYSLKNNREKDRNYFSSSGFALIYDDNLFVQKVINKKMNNNEIKIMHNLLKANTPVKIINPSNSKIIETKIYKKANYPEIFSVVISANAAKLLDLDTENPFVELIETKKNKTFVAKKSNTFEEEKNVAAQVPVNEVIMDDLSKDDINITKKSIKKNSFVLVISDFYYEDTATNLMKELIKNNKLNNISVKKINNKKYRLLAGPFKNFNALKTTYISLNEIGFENLNIYRD
jgi:hypothetical protein